MYSQKWNCAASFLRSTFVSLWAICIFPRSVHLFCCIKICGPIVGIYKSLTDTWLWTLGTRTHSFISGNIFSNFDKMYSVFAVQSKRRNALLSKILTLKNGWNWAMPHVETRWDWTPSWIPTSFQWWMPPSVQTASSSKKVSDCHWLIKYMDTKAKCRCSARDWDGKDYLRIIPRVVW
jgi:hypothetical protein